MPIAGWIELSLDIIPRGAAQATPGSYFIGVDNRVKTVPHPNPNKIGNQITVMMVVPNKYLDL